MRVYAVVLFCLSVVAVTLPAAAAPLDEAIATVSVNGRAEIPHAPDLATVNLTIETSDGVAARALSENNRRFAALGAKLASIGVAANAVRSAGLNSYENPRPNAPAPGSGPFGFFVSRSVAVDVPLPGNPGGVVDAATAVNATRIDGISYGLRDRRSLERLALAAAVADAAAQAQAIASAAHVHVIRVMRISDQSVAGGLPRAAVPLAVARGASEPTVIAPSDLTVTATVEATYEIR